MADIYNLTVFDNSTDYLQMAKAVDTLSGGQFMIWVLISLSFILLVGFTFKQKDFKEAFLITSVIMSIVCLIAWAGNLISWQILLVPITCVFVSYVVYKFTG
jgi:Ca2+/Na+ antiporter